MKGYLLMVATVYSLVFFYSNDVVFALYMFVFFRFYVV